MFEALKARGRALTNGKARRTGAGRGKAAVSFAARLTFDDLSRRYGATLALDHVSLDIAPGEILCLLGPSGCGKSTLLRIAAGVERPSAGRVLLDEQEVGGPERFVPPEKRGVGLMFQDFALFPHLSILDNAAFGLRSLTRPKPRPRLMRRWIASASPTMPTNIRISSPAASSSAWRSPAPSRPARACF